MRKKGFTLVELLAVIVILALIALIAVPIIGSIIESSKKKAAIETARNYINALDDKLDLMYVDDGKEINSGVYSVTNESIEEYESINDYVQMTGKLPDSGMVSIDEKSDVESSTLCIGKYLVEYDEKKEYNINGSCELSGSETAITLNTIMTATSDKISVYITTLSPNITSYLYSIDGGEYIKTTLPRYTFKNLKKNTEYTIKIKVYNSKGASKEITKKVTTEELSPPEFVINNGWATNKTIEINYPTKEDQKYTYQYSYDLVNWKVSSTSNKKIKFLTNGYVVARVKDEGGNITNSTTLNISKIDSTVTGTIITYVNSTGEDSNNMKDGYLLCDGKEISRSEYADLFNVIGTTYGAGNGTTTFNLPNYNGKTPVGVNSSNTAFASLGKTGGEKTHQITLEELPSHNHTFTGSPHTHTFTGKQATSGTVSANHTHTIPAHTHTVPATSTASGIQYASGSPYSHTHYTNYRSTGQEVAGYSAIPGALGFQNRLVVTGTINTSYAKSNGAHTHTFSVNASTTGGPSTSTSADSNNHTHTVTGTGKNANTSISGTIGNSGSNQAHNNLQPYIVNTYYIKY